tara:strand:- start:592 stop:738 length:147 start_codon:yes stop_codon:yes gene_type:complete
LVLEVEGLADQAAALREVVVAAAVAMAAAILGAARRAPAVQPIRTSTC